MPKCRCTDTCPAEINAGDSVIEKQRYNTATGKQEFILLDHIATKRFVRDEIATQMDSGDED